jgi:hypothetical protein
MEAAAVDWIGVYKLARLALLAGVLAFIAVYLWRRPELERPAQRMLEDGE